MTEINKTHYCSAGFWDYGEGLCRWDHYRDCKDCKNYHRKHPTVEQFEAEYGFPVPPDMPVWVNYDIGMNDTAWELTKYGNGFLSGDKKRFFGVEHSYKVNAIVVSCTPWGKPPDTWRPE